MNLHEILKKEYTDFVPGDWELSDLLDGNGPFISAWTRTEDQPTTTEIDGFITTYDAEVVEADKWLKIRDTRDQLLRNSDFTQVNDIPFDQTTKDAWIAYRQSLRDLPNTFTNADDVIWPTEPA